MTQLEEKTREELLSLAQREGLENGTTLTSFSRSELLQLVLRNHSDQQGSLIARGILEIMSDGYGFLRQYGLKPQGHRDVYVSQSQIRRFSLRTGDMVAGQVRPPKDSERYFGLIRVEAVNGLEAETARNRPHFESLIPVFPDEQMKLETTSKNLSTRLIDLLAPVGKGQRGMVVSPPKAGKTMLLKDIANGITTNHPEISLIVALIGERPEEVTDVSRSVSGEIFGSTFDEPVEDHCRVAEQALERAKRLVEGGKDVAILLDSITRLTRAYNLALPTSGRTLSGGIDPVALYPPKRFFGAARNSEAGGSLTIIATCLVETGSRMDDVIYEEFKGTGNWELHLTRKLAEKRIFPAVDIQRSGTRREELLLDETTLRQVWLLRRMVSLLNSDGVENTEAAEKILESLSKTKTNSDFLATINKAS
ncbi:MAG: transcription termination factor Rho [SAR202 cluster bacterium Io17-Chloro-G3]|nr:MAG: transcription termination factor Rho [SAR202 cluster bacterium Io17-Chloro-G3]